MKRCCVLWNLELFTINVWYNIWKKHRCRGKKCCSKSAQISEHSIVLVLLMYWRMLSTMVFWVNDYARKKLILPNFHETLIDWGNHPPPQPPSLLCLWKKTPSYEINKGWCKVTLTWQALSFHKKIFNFFFYVISKRQTITYISNTFRMC